MKKGFLALYFLLITGGSTGVTLMQKPTPWIGVNPVGTANGGGGGGYIPGGGYSSGSRNWSAGTGGAPSGGFGGGFGGGGHK